MTRPIRLEQCSTCRFWVLASDQGMNQFSFTFRTARDSHPTVLAAGKHFRFDIERYSKYFLNPMPSQLIDMLRIATAIYVTDRLVRRKREGRYWSRTLGVDISVLNPEFWSTAKVRHALIDAIQFLSDDTWEFAFHRDERCPKCDVQRELWPVAADARVCLYSGGLDSAAGLAVWVATDSSRPVIPVTVWHQPIQRKLIHEQFKLLRTQLQVEIEPIILKLALIGSPEIKQFREERSQRCRAFLFMAAGAAAAAMAGDSTVEIYESGIGAINLPLMSGMAGSKTTRSVHPRFLKRMSDFVSLVCDKPMAFELPFVAQTKGQIVSELVRRGLSELAHLSVSCVHHPLRDAKHKQCGICPACIFRRQAMMVAGIQESANTYKYDVFCSSRSANRIGRKQWKYFRAFLAQVDQLDDVEPGEPLPECFLRYLIGTGILSCDESTEPIARLLGTYRDEWRRIEVQAAARGFSWTELVAHNIP